MTALRVAAVALASALVLLTPAARGAAGDELRLAPAGKPPFPQRSFALTLPAERSLSPAQVHVRENGRTVSRPSVTAAEATGERFGFVLVIDASSSMRGRAIEGALSAAREFAHHRHPQQKLGIVTFNRSASTALPLTADPSAIETAVSRTPALDNGTHVYDAVQRGLSLLAEARVATGSIVVLSDGADTGSVTGSAEVAAAAKAAGVRIFTVGLRSRSFRGAALSDLARSAGGRYSEARSTKRLSTVYGELGSLLANEYLIEYRSLAGPGEQVRVEVTVDGTRSAASSDYVTPALQPVESPSADAGSGFWASPAAMVAVSVACALVIALAVIAMLAFRPRKRALRQRLEGFITPHASEEEDESSDRRLTGLVFGGAERSLERTRWWSSFKEELEIARVPMPAVQVVLWTSVGTLFALWILYGLSGSALLSLPAFAVPVAVRAILKRLLARQRTLFSDQLADNLLVVASAMRAGHSFAGALSVAAEDAPEPAQTEFQRVIADEKLGVSIEEGLELVARRMQSRDLEQVVLVAGLHRETGGDSAEVLELVAATVRERSELRRTVDTLTAQGRLSRWVVTCLPIGLLFLISAINPHYMQPLYNTGTGHVMLVLAAVLLTIGSLVIKRIVSIKI